MEVCDMTERKGAARERGTGRGVVGGKGDAPAAAVAGEGIRDVVKRVLVSPAEGWEGWVMRLFDVEPGGHTPRHAHDWPHINFVAAGRGELYLDGEEHALAAGSYAYVPAGLIHQFRNTGDEVFSFVCIVPERGDA
jgi:quercetin dioxygenase-like cupin family protein